jgi:Flp pilus assembly protein TadD
MVRAVEWTKKARREAPADSPFAGVLPAAPADGECLWDGKHHIPGYDLWNLRGMLCTADAARVLGKSAEADGWARKWIADHPKDVAMRMHLAGREFAAKNLKAAAAHYRVVVDLQPNNAVALNDLAWIGGELGDPKAIGYAERAVRLAPNNAAFLDTYGMLLVNKGEAGKGFPFLERARQLAPTHSELRLNYAKALIKLGRKDEARKELEALQAVKEPFRGREEVAGLLKGL